MNENRFQKYKRWSSAPASAPAPASDPATARIERESFERLMSQREELMRELDGARKNIADLEAALLIEREALAALRASIVQAPVLDAQADAPVNPSPKTKR